VLKATKGNGVSLHL